MDQMECCASLRKEPMESIFPSRKVIGQHFSVMQLKQNTLHVTAASWAGCFGAWANSRGCISLIRKLTTVANFMLFRLGNSQQLFYASCSLSLWGRFHESSQITAWVHLDCILSSFSFFWCVDGALGNHCTVLFVREIMPFRNATVTLINTEVQQNYTLSTQIAASMTETKNNNKEKKTLLLAGWLYF